MGIDKRLIEQAIAIAGAERTTGRTRALWLALFRLLVNWWRE